MNEKLLKRLGLKPDATPTLFEEAIGVLADRADALAKENDLLREESKLHQELLAKSGSADASKLENRIARKIAESGGALNREQAQMAIQHQDEAVTAAAKKKAAKK